MFKRIWLTWLMITISLFGIESAISYGLTRPQPSCGGPIGNPRNVNGNLIEVISNCVGLGLPPRHIGWPAYYTKHLSSTLSPQFNTWNLLLNIAWTGILGFLFAWLIDRQRNQNHDKKNNETSVS